MSQLLSALIGAACGAIFTLFSGLFRELRDRRKRRKSLATVLLCELRSADVTLRHLYKSPRGIMPSDAFSVFNTSNDALDVFEPATVRLIVDFAGSLNGIRDLLDHAVEERFSRSTEFYSILYAHTAGAVSKIPELKAALEEEGGSYIPFTPAEIPSWEEGATDPPPLPESSFRDVNV